MSLAACAGGDSLADLRAFVERTKALPGGEVEPVPEVAQVETFLYLPADRRDPFAPSKEPSDDETGSGAVGDIMPDRTRRKEELEFFPLDSLDMVGTLDKDGVKWGLVRNTDGMLYRVQTGNYMGQNHGQIIEITDVEIKLSEILADGQGAYRENPASVALSE
jgi:type IV pilus assembly protein PilP